jgi:type VI secretion system protein ImpH
MATQGRRQTFDIKESIVTNGKRFSFVQALRMLRCLMSETCGGNLDEETIGRSIRVRPQLSLNFPDTDIASIEEIPRDPPFVLLTVTFLGLYGVSSPLPTFYTEDLIDEKIEEVTVVRDFLDIINAPFYRLFYQCWNKYRQFVKIIDEQDPVYLERLFCFLGLGIEEHRREIPDVQALIPYVGLFTQFPRSALGLKTLLTDILHVHSLDVVQCVRRKAVIPEDQRLFLGTSRRYLGVDSYVGQEVGDRMGAFRIVIGPVEADTFHEFLPDTQKFDTMARIIRLYLDNPLTWESEVSLYPGEVKTVCLGESRWSRLGWDTWIFSEKEYPFGVSTAFREPVANDFPI